MAQLIKLHGPRVRETCFGVFAALYVSITFLGKRFIASTETINLTCLHCDSDQLQVISVQFQPSVVFHSIFHKT